MQNNSPVARHLLSQIIKALWKTRPATGNVDYPGQQFDFRNTMKRRTVFYLALSLLTFAGQISAPAQNATASPSAGTLIINSVSVAGKSVPLDQSHQVKLGAFPDNITFHFGPTNLNRLPIRLRYKLEGYDSNWHEEGGEMYFGVRFYNDSIDQVGQDTFKIHGASAGWNGSLKNSSLTHRRETMTVPPQGSHVMVVISSAGPPATEGVYVVANLLVTDSSEKSPLTDLIRSPFDRQPDDNNLSLAPKGWARDGTHSSMAKIVRVGRDSATKAFAILDDDPASHAEWRNSVQFLPKVTPGDELVVEWNEMFSMGVGDVRLASYAHLTPGIYNFHVEEVDIFGVPMGLETSLKIIISPPFWKLPWFWVTVLISFAAIMFGAGRYVIWHKMQREMVQLKNQQALERERLRIAHDIHDDMGARVTQISLLSAMSQDNAAFPEKARADFNRISQMSRELVAALYETVWTVNPENDNLDALGNYVCQMVNQLCTKLQLRCRFHVQDLPREIQVSSQIRHNISMTVKEAVHNIIKHAHASEVGIHMAFTGNVLTISIEDDGRGFLPANHSAGNGLTNMKRRLQDIGGNCAIESRPEKGTVVRLRLVIKSTAKK